MSSPITTYKQSRKTYLEHVIKENIVFYFFVIVIFENCDIPITSRFSQHVLTLSYKEEEDKLTYRCNGYYQRSSEKSNNEFFVYMCFRNLLKPRCYCLCFLPFRQKPCSFSYCHGFTEVLSVETLSLLLSDLFSPSGLINIAMPAHPGPKFHLATRPHRGHQRSAQPSCGAKVESCVSQRLR